MNKNDYYQGEIEGVAAYTTDKYDTYEECKNEMRLLYKRWMKRYSHREPFLSIWHFRNGRKVNALIALDDLRDIKNA